MAPHSAISVDGSSPQDLAESFAAATTVLVSSRAVVLGRLTPATVVVSRDSGKIVALYDSVLHPTHFPPTIEYVDYSPHILMPGLVDAHVHLNEPGRTEWEGFWTGTRAAAFGGVTTVIDMPLNAIPPTTTVANLEEKVQAAKEKCWVDIGFYGGIIPGNTSELRSLVHAGVRGFKCFLIDSGVDEFPAVSSADISEAMVALSDLPTTVMFHAEMIPPFTTSNYDHAASCSSGPADAYQTFLDSRPPSFETSAISEIVRLSVLAPDLPLHIVHLSAIEAIPILRDAKQRGVNITAETCFHYLSLAAEEIANGDTRHKCCPPIRNSDNQNGLWREMMRMRPSEIPVDKTDSSVIRTIVSDHSPCTPDLKLLPTSLGGHAKDGAERMNGERGDFLTAWGGISSVGLGLSILWSEHEKRGFDILDVVKWCCENTAKQVGLEHRKGFLAIGMDADIAVFDDAVDFVVKPSIMLFRNKTSPYQGKKLKGVVKETWVRGTRVYSRDKGFTNEYPTGELLLEPRMPK